MLHNSSVGRSWEQPGQLSAGSSGGDACECPGGRASIGPPALLTGGAGGNRAAVPVLGVHGDARSGGARGSDAHVAVLLAGTMGLAFGDASGCFQRGRDLQDNLRMLHVLSIIRNSPQPPRTSCGFGPSCSKPRLLQLHLGGGPEQQQQVVIVGTEINPRGKHPPAETDGARGALKPPSPNLSLCQAWGSRLVTVPQSQGDCCSPVWVFRSQSDTH